MATIPFNTLAPLHALLRDELTAATTRVIDSAWYVLGAEGEAFEAEFAAFHTGDDSTPLHAVGVANGTDAIELALRGLGIGPSDEVITTAHTAVATVCAIERVGAIPILADIDPITCTLDPDAAAAAITPRTKAILPVHIYGGMADLPRLRTLCDRHALALIEDCAQSHAATLDGRMAGTWGDIAAFSFYPTKNLGALGDGGAVLTRDPALAARLRRLRTYGQSSRYIHDERGINSRLDEMQAALLRVKLRHLPAHTADRRRMATLYATTLAGSPVRTPAALPGCDHAYHLYVIQTDDRDGLMTALKTQGIGTAIHYPIPIHRQAAYASLGYADGSLPVTERIARQIVSLPLYIGLADADLHTVAHAIHTHTTVTA